MRCCGNADASENKQQFIGIASPPATEFWAPFLDPLLL